MDSFAMGEHVWAVRIAGGVPLSTVKVMGRDVCNGQRVPVARGDFCQPVPTHVAEIGGDYVGQQENTLRRVVAASLAAS